MSAPLPCIVCNKTPEEVGPWAGKDEEPAQPYGATTFYTYGQYGSTAFDPEDESQLKINVCDKCLKQKAGATWHVRYIRQPALTVFSKPWNPDEEQP